MNRAAPILPVRTWWVIPFMRVDEPSGNLRSMKHKELERWLASLMTSLGFREKAGSWFREHEETVLVVSLQKSDYGWQYYLNFGIWLKRLGEQRFPKEHLCHVRVRLTGLLDESKREPVASALDLENVLITSEEREAILSEISDDIIRPFISAAASLSGIAELRRRGVLDSAFVHRAAQDELNE